MSTSLCSRCWTVRGYAAGIEAPHRCAHGAVCRLAKGGELECPECYAVECSRIVAAHVLPAFQLGEGTQPVMTPELVRLLGALVRADAAAQVKRDDRGVP